MLIFFLTLGGFAIGSSEFIAMGALPEIAREMDPAAVALSPEIAAGHASVFVWGYALGVVIGAPIFAMISIRIRQKTYLVMALTLMAALTIATAIASPFYLIIVFRISAALPHGAYFGVGAVVAARLLGDAHQARGVAIVLGGLTVANLIGSPVGTWLAQTISWRLSYLIVGGLFTVAAIGVFVMMQSDGSGPALRGSARSSRSMWRLSLWRLIGGYAVLNASFFAVLTFAAPILTDLAHFSTSAVVALMVTIGAGMTIGNYLGGAIADRTAEAALWSTVAVAGLGFVAFWLGMLVPGLVFAGFAMCGYSLGAVSPYIQARLARATPDNPQLGSSLSSLCGNAGSVVGGLVGSIAVVGTDSMSATITVGSALFVLGVAACAALSRGASPDRAALG